FSNYSGQCSTSQFDLFCRCPFSSSWLAARSWRHTWASAYSWSVHQKNETFRLFQPDKTAGSYTPNTLPVSPETLPATSPHTPSSFESRAAPRSEFLVLLPESDCQCTPLAHPGTFATRLFHFLARTNPRWSTRLCPQ